MQTYRIVRFYQHHEHETLIRGLTREQAEQHCADPETSWKTATSEAATRRTRDLGPWFDGWTAE